MIRKFLTLFVKPLTAHDKYSLLNRDSLAQRIQTHLSQKLFFFKNVFLLVSNLAELMNILKKKMTFVADIFPKLGTREKRG